MKKLFSTLLCASLIFGNLACFAETTKTITTSYSSVPLESKYLKEKYSAYNVSFTNKGNTPIRIDNFRSGNLINDMEKINEACQMPTKLMNTLSFLGFFTLGISSLVSIPVMQSNFKNMKKASSEVCKYKNVAFLNTKNEIIMPEQGVTFGVLVPLNAIPVMTAVFEDTKTHEFISVDTSK